MSGAGYHGWSLSDGKDWALHVGHLDGRKSVCLYLRKGHITRILAFFRSEEAAQEALRVIDRLSRV